MTQPTTAELKAALDVLTRQLGAQKKYSRAQLDAMSPAEVAEALNENPAAFDKIEQAEND